MKVVRNIPGAIKLYATLRHLTQFKKEIETAKACGDFERERAFILKAQSAWSHSVFAMFGSELTVLGKEHLPKEGPVVFIGNHQGYGDIIAYCAALSSLAFGFVAKDDLDRVPLYGAWIRRIRSVLIARNDPRASLRAIDEGIALIAQGFSLMIFPEGTRSKCGDMGAFKRGAFKLACKPEVPIIPVSLDGSYRMFEETGVIQGAKIRVMVHPPMETAGLSPGEQKKLVQEVENIVRDGVRQLQKS